MTDVLKGVRVVELSTVITAPLTGMMLADLGADVIKVEHPQGGDPFRNFRGSRYSPNFVAYNRGKRSIQLDLRTPAGRAVLLKLIARADVLLENYRPGIMDKLGLGADALEAANPRLIHCSITGFGEGGPYSARPAYDNVAVALSGIASLQLDPEQPQSSGPTIADNATGMFACYGILGALFERERSGRGHRVEVNMLEAGIAFIPDPFANYTRAGIRNDRLTRVAASQSFAFRCADGELLAVHLSSQTEILRRHRRRDRAPGVVRDARFATRDLRIANYAESPACWRRSSPPGRGRTGWRCSRQTTCRSRRCRAWRTCSTIRRCDICARSTPSITRPKARSPPSTGRCWSTAAATSARCRRPRWPSTPTRCCRSSATMPPRSASCARPRWCSGL